MDLQKILDLHTTTVVEINTFYGKYHSANHALNTVFHGEIWRVKGLEHVKFHSNDITIECFVLPDRIVTIGNNRKQKYISGTIKSPSEYIGFESNPWREALLSVDSAKGCRQPLADHIQQYFGKASINEDMQTQLIQIINEKGNVIYTIDPNHSYLLSKKEHRGNGRTTVELVEQFQEVSRGIYFPMRVVKREGNNGEWKTVSEITFSSIQINKPISDNIFKPKFPVGMRVTDKIAGTEYTIDSKSGGQKDIVPLETFAVGSPSQPLQKATKDEPNQPYWWILPVSIGILSLVLIRFIVIKVRSTTLRKV